MNRIRRNAGIMAVGVTLAAAIAIAGGKHGEHTSTKTAKDDEAVHSYPLKACLVSGEALGSMGKPHTIVFKQEIKFCCKGCVKDFKKDPLKYVGKLATTAAAHRTEGTGDGHESKHADKHAEGSTEKKGHKHDHGGHDH